MTKGLYYSYQKLLLKMASSTPKNISSYIAPLIAMPGMPRTSDFKYQNWLNKNYPHQSALKKMLEEIPVLDYTPSISIIMPVCNTPTKFLRAAIQSVLNQVYPYWELCIAGDDTDNQIREILEEYSSRDSRIKVVFSSENGDISHGDISQCSNSALKIATGEFISLLDPDDLLTPDALYQVVLLLNRYPTADMIYSDEDKIDENDYLRDPFFKPDWCPDSFLSRMYTCHLGTYRRELVNAVGNFRIGYEGSEHYDLVLRLTEKTTQIFHIPKILYHWRISPQSALNNPDQKPYTLIESEKALADALARRCEIGQADKNGEYCRISYNSIYNHRL